MNWGFNTFLEGSCNNFFYDTCYFQDGSIFLQLNSMESGENNPIVSGAVLSSGRIGPGVQLISGL